MQFKIRAINECGVASAYSRTLILTITKSGGGGAPAKDCSGQEDGTVSSRPRPSQPKVDDYDSRVANAIHHYWADLLRKKKDHATEAVAWAFPDRGRETEMMKATPYVERAISGAIA
jgi:hypothetical protein